MMRLISYGLNHKSAHIGVREQLAFSPENTSTLLTLLLQHTAANEAVLLSTCNRTELYAVTPDPLSLKQWFLNQYQGKEDISHYCYDHQEQACIKHLIRVACGLDSMILGEPQILGQLKQAYQLADAIGGVGPKLKQLFPAVFAASKQIRYQSQVGHHPVSLAYAIVQLGKRIFSQLDRSQVLIIGAGTQMESITTHLFSQGIRHFIIASRHLENAQSLAHLLQGQAIQLADIPNYLTHVNIVISATHSPLPLIGKGMVESAIKRRKHKPILMVDLAVPRDIEPEVAQLSDIYLYNIDDLDNIIAASWQHRESAAQQAEIMVNQQSQQLMRKLHLHQARTIIQQFRQQALQWRDIEVAKALRAIEQGQDAKQIIHNLAHKLTNKILHQPTIKLREAAAEQQYDMLHLLKQLLEV